MSPLIIPEPSTEGLERKFDPPPVKSVGCYSNDAQRNFIDGAGNLKFVHLFPDTKSVRFDLNRGINWKKFKEYDTVFIPKRKEQNSRLFHFLQWINQHQEQFENNRPDFVMLRGMMEKIVTTPYRCRFNEDWRLGAIRKNGTIYIRKILREEQRQPKTNRFLVQASAWGHNFEKFVLSDEPNEKPNPKNKENPGAECHIVLQTNIDGHEILYSAELDGVAAKEGFDILEMNPKENLEAFENCHLVEVKTCVTTQQDKLHHTGFRRNKSRTWWVQAALGGITNVIVGYKDDQGLVKTLENIPMTDLYEKYGSGWYGESGYKFFGDFLTQVKERVVEDDTVYIFSFDRREQNGQNEFLVEFEVPDGDEGAQYLLENLV